MGSCLSLISRDVRDKDLIWWFIKCFSLNMGASRALIPTGYNQHLISFQFGILAFWHFDIFVVPSLSHRSLSPNTNWVRFWAFMETEYRRVFSSEPPPPPKKKNQQGNKLVLQEKGPSSRLVVASGAHKYSFSLPTLGFFVQTTNKKKIYPSSCVNALANSNSEGHDNQPLYMNFI